jgi:hypothetical protein
VLIPVLVFMTAMLAFGMTAPDASATVPCMDAVVTCASAFPWNAIDPKAKIKIPARRL